MRTLRELAERKAQKADDGCGRALRYPASPLAKKRSSFSAVFRRRQHDGGRYEARASGNRRIYNEADAERGLRFIHWLLLASRSVVPDANCACSGCRSHALAIAGILAVTRAR